MKTIQSFGGPLMGIDRQSLSRWGGVFHSSFFAENSAFANDYEEMCGQLDGRRSNNLSILKGTHAEAILIDLPLPTFIVEANSTSVHLVQIWSSEQGWSKSTITMVDFQNADDWGDSVSFFVAVGSLSFLTLHAPMKRSRIISTYILKEESTDANRSSKNEKAKLISF